MEVPGAIAIDAVSTFVLDHGKAPGKSATVRRAQNSGSPVLSRLPAITPFMSAVSGLAIDASTGGCLYFIGNDGAGVGSRVYVYPKVAPAL